MPLQNINVVNATLQVTAAASLDYSTVLIVDCNHINFDRATSFVSVDDYTSVVSDGTNLRRALDSAFSASVNPPIVVTGRAKGNSRVSFTGVSNNVEYAFTLEVPGGESITVSYTADIDDDEFDVATALAALVNANTDAASEVTATVEGVGIQATLLISLLSNDNDFIIYNETSNIALSGETTESAADTISEIRKVNSDWTYIVSTNHSPDYQKAMASQGLLYEKLYVTSTDLEAAYDSWDGQSTPASDDIGAYFQSTGNNFAHAMYHDDADSYPEVLRITEFTDVTPGADDFNYSTLSGFGVAKNSEGNVLSGNDLTNLQGKYMSTIVSLGGQPVIAGNRVSTGVRIEAIAVLNYFRQELQRRVDTLFLRMRKLGINDPDIGLIGNAWTSFLDSNVSDGAGNAKALDPFKPYEITLPKAKDVSYDNRVLGFIPASIVCNLDASIDSTALNLTLTYRDPSEA